MSELRSFGVKSIKLGDIPDDGSMSITLAALGLTYQDSASLKEAEGTVTDVFAEEVDFPVESFQDLGQTMLAFSIMDLTAAGLLKLKGGTLVEGSWGSPRAIVDIEQSAQIITRRNVLIEIPRGKVRAVLNFDLKKKQVALVDIKMPALLPNMDGLAPVSITPYDPPTVNAGVDQALAPAATVANLVGTATAFRGDIVSQVWTVKSKPAGAADPVMATPDALANALSVLTTVGDYIFTLTVTDSNGFSNSDDVKITTS